jgi:hypothetical protein
VGEKESKGFANDASSTSSCGDALWRVTWTERQSMWRKGERKRERERGVRERGVSESEREIDEE